MNNKNDDDDDDDDDDDGLRENGNWESNLIENNHLIMNFILFYSHIYSFTCIYLCIYVQ